MRRKDCPNRIPTVPTAIIYRDSNRSENYIFFRRRSCGEEKACTIRCVGKEWLCDSMAKKGNSVHSPFGRQGSCKLGRATEKGTQDVRNSGPDLEAARTAVAEEAPAPSVAEAPGGPGGEGEGRAWALAASCGVGEEGEGAGRREGRRGR